MLGWPQREVQGHWRPGGSLVLAKAEAPPAGCLQRKPASGVSGGFPVGNAVERDFVELLEGVGKGPRISIKLSYFPYKSRKQ